MLAGQAKRIAWMAPILLIGLLLFPSTCTEASMVHPIFTDPANLSDDRQNERPNGTEANGMGMTQAEHNLHVAMGHIVSATDTTPSVSTGEDDPCANAPKVRSMPEEMLMNVAGVSAIFEPVTDPEPAISANPAIDLAQVLAGTDSRVEDPPPR